MNRKALSDKLVVKNELDQSLADGTKTNRGMTLEPDLVRVRAEEKRSGSRVEKDKDQSVASSATTKPALPKQPPTTRTAGVTTDKVTNQSKATMDRIHKKEATGSTANGSSISLGTSSSSQSKFDELLQYFIKTFIFSKKFSC
jgi:hypothetical protein